MRVNIDEIKEAGLHRSWDVPRETLDEMVSGDRAGFRAGGPAHVDARLDRVERRVLLTAHASVKVDGACSRCLAPVTVEVPVDFDLALVPAAEYQDPDGTNGDSGPIAGSFDPNAADEETYEGKFIDLDPIVREQVVLALPGYPVCREGCKGLCPACGANLNDKECGCDRHVPDPRWAGLKNVKLQ
jgi:uncharacterized protein